MILIPLLQCNPEGIIDVILRIDDSVKVLQTITIRTFLVTVYKWFFISAPKSLYYINKVTDIG